MKKKVLCLLLILVLVFPVSFGLSGLTAHADDEDYIEIRTIDDLYNVRNDLTANYKLMNDIDMSETSDPDSIYNYYGMGWDPIGNDGSYLYNEESFFTGCFDGNGHTISNLYIDYNKTVSVEGRYYVGLFFVNNGTIKNLHIRNSNISAQISSNPSSVYPQMMVGSIAGYNYKQGIITRCSFDGIMTGSSNYQNKDAPTGGICGGNMNTIIECYNMGSITSSRTASGIFSHTDDGSSAAINCYNIGTIKTTYTSSAGKDGDPITPYKKYNSYYVKTNGDTVSGGYYDSSGSLTELTESQLMKQMYFPGCDFENTWKFETATDYKFPQLRNNMMDTAKHVDVIEWKSSPTKIDYYTDEDIDPSGGVFRAYYIDDTHEDIEVTKDMLSGYDMSQLGVQTVTVTFREGTLTYDILTSTRPEVRSLTLETMPDKTEFARGTAFDFTGATAKVEYVNGKTDIIPITAEETTGGNINQSGTYTITFEKFGKTITFEVKVVPVKPVGIKIASPPDKTTYIEGQSLDLTGLVVKLEYNSGKTETITDYTVGEYENTVGTKTISVSYEDFTTSFTVEFVEKNLTAIMVTTQPSKAKYVVGEAFDRTGMVVKAVYDNGMSEEIDDYTVSDIPEVTGWQTLTVSYNGKTTTIKVMVEAKELVSIFVSQMPLKTTYIEGETFDPEGMVVMANYNDVLSEEITDYTLSGTNLNKVGESRITVLYEGMTATFNVTVVEKKLVRITVTPPTKKEYIAGEAFDETGMEVKAVYDNGKSETVTGYTVSGFGDTEEENVITIGYGGKASSFIVTIHSPEAEWTITKAPTCTEGGSQELHCANCGKVLKTEALDVLGHSWVKEYVVDLAPTCASEGSESWHCSVCGASDPDHTRAIAKLPHNLGEWTITKEATCAAPGVKQRACADCDFIETEEIPATGNHTFGDWATITEPTCTEKGSKTRECSVCHLVETTEIPVTDHTWNTEYTVDKKATLAAKGSKSIHCSVCDAIDPDTVVSIPKLTVKATSITKVPAAKKGFTVKWKKVSGITGYEIQYATNSKFTKGKKTVKITKVSTTSKKITKLKAKKKYYVRVRAYKTYKGKKYYSKWSKYKYVTTKK